ncbi:hypothetical protein EDD36DRAFT_100239 [Exophiala viscosa]|uniref:BTB domain-containing protein n=1 Tax=Exophiala viscosa TaxID=2486360 RepID=A0AAN6DLY7_9EURO|nr:hypothetical protein EDD36DRAFT_100239 [Exophiala viscosa]
MPETKIVKAGMTAEHARWPVIKVIVHQSGDNGQDTDVEPDDVRMNVFYVHQYFLIAHSHYFATILDVDNPLTPPVARLTLSKPICTSDNTEGHCVFGDWLNAMYQGTTEQMDSIPLKDFELQPRFDFADMIGSPSFKNMMMDTIQQRGIETWTVCQVNGLHLMPTSASLYVDYAIECMAYRVVTKGWTGVMDADLGVCVTKWKEFFREGRNVDTFNELLARVDMLHKAKDTNHLINPTEVKDCKWHEHTDESRKECPRHRSKKNLGGTSRITGLTGWIESQARNV